MEAVAVYSDADAGAMPTSALADIAVRIGPPPPTESYLRIDAIVEVALATGAEAIHPGYGFLSERAAFARAVEDAGLVFVGPPSSVIDALGDKLHAREIARSVGVDAVPGTLRAGAGRPCRRLDGDRRRGRADRLPVAGQGRGRRWGTGDASGRRRGRAACRAGRRIGRGGVGLRRRRRSTWSARSVPARHIEVQLLGDATGRSSRSASATARCSAATRSSSRRRRRPGLTTDGTTSRCTTWRSGSRLPAGLRNAATAEFLRAPDGAFYFLEVNTRLQVEHGVTELVSGLDIVHEQFRLAAGAPLSAAALAAAARAAEPSGHAIEVRLSAEDPARDFAPGPGRIDRWVMPAGPGVRVDTGLGPAIGSRPTTTTWSPRSWSTPGTGTPRSTGFGGRSTRPRSPASRRPCRSTGSWRDMTASGPATCRSTGWPRSGTAPRSGSASVRVAAACRGRLGRRGRAPGPAPSGRVADASACRQSPWLTAATRLDATDRWPG